MRNKNREKETENLLNRNVLWMCNDVCGNVCERVVVYVTEKVGVCVIECMV